MNTGTSYSGSHVGIHLVNCDFGSITDMVCHANLDRGVILEDTVRITCSSITFKNPSVSSFYFKGTLTADITIVGDQHTSGSNPYAFDAGVKKESISFLGGMHVYNGGVADTVVGLSSSQTIEYYVQTSDQVHFLQGNTGSGAYVVILHMNDAVATDGDIMVFHVTLTNIQPTFRFTNDSGGTLIDLVGTASITHYCVDLVYTEATWKVLRAVPSLA